jgi:hypothetical protein
MQSCGHETVTPMTTTRDAACGAAELLQLDGLQELPGGAGVCGAAGPRGHDAVAIGAVPAWTAASLLR